MHRRLRVRLPGRVGARLRASRAAILGRSFLLDGLRSRGVRTKDVMRDPRMRTGVTINLVKGETRSQVTYPGAMAEFAEAHIGEKVFRGLRHLHVSGIFQALALLPGLSRLIGRAHSVGASVSLDCQWDQSERWERVDQWMANVDWLFANSDEACSMTGRASAEDALRALGSRTKCPVVKAGAGGALVLQDGTPVAVPAPRVSVVDTVGAGDNFDAGFLYGMLERGMTLLEGARFAMPPLPARACSAEAPVPGRKPPTSTPFWRKTSEPFQRPSSASRIRARRFLHTAREIDQQPRLWAKVLDLLAEKSAEIGAFLRSAGMNGRKSSTVLLCEPAPRHSLEIP